MGGGEPHVQFWGKHKCILSTFKALFQSPYMRVLNKRINRGNLSLFFFPPHTYAKFSYFNGIFDNLEIAKHALILGQQDITIGG